MKLEIQFKGFGEFKHFQSLIIMNRLEIILIYQLLYYPK
jgi:hypothetical protein